MYDRFLRRWLAGAGVVAALVASTAGAALAQAPAPRLGVYLGDVTVAPGQAGKVLTPVFLATEPVTLQQTTLTFELTGLGSGVTLGGGRSTGECSTGNGRLVCETHGLGASPQGDAGLVAVVLAAAAGSAGSGRLTTTVHAVGYEPVSYTSAVRVGEGVDLAAGADAKVSAAPGEGFTAALTVRNAGGSTARGAVAVFSRDYAVRAGVRHSNCSYDDQWLRSCRFDEELAPGAGYSAAVPYRLGADTHAPGQEINQAVWMTPAEFEDYAGELRRFGGSVGTPGAGSRLPLVRSGAARVAAAPQADGEIDNNWWTAEVTVTGKNGGDLAAIGDSVSGAAGDLVTVTIGLVNRGPAAFDSGRSGEPVTRLRLELPAGTAAVAQPEGCSVFEPDDDDAENEFKPGVPAYLCPSGTFIGVGQRQTWEIRLRIDRVIPNATGRVWVNAPCACTGMDRDLDPRNDTAPVVVNPTAGPGGGAPTGPGGGRTGGATGGQGAASGGLPVTGAPAGVLAGTGLLLVLGGVALARRRVRFRP